MEVIYHAVGCLGDISHDEERKAVMQLHANKVLAKEVARRGVNPVTVKTEWEYDHASDRTLLNTTAEFA